MDIDVKTSAKLERLRVRVLSNISLANEVIDLSCGVRDDVRAEALLKEMVDRFHQIAIAELNGDECLFQGVRMEMRGGELKKFEDALDLVLDLN